MEKLETYGTLAGRSLLASVFVLSGLSKIGSYAAIHGYMEAFGLPGVLLAPTILFEIGAGLALIAGWQTRIVALLLGGFSILTALVFHRDFADPDQITHFLKNLSIAGGLIVLALHGAGGLSADGRLQSRRASS
jgi:putative oxidoreductase